MTKLIPNESEAGDTVATIAVFALPPKDSFQYQSKIFSIKL